MARMRRFCKMNGKQIMQKLVENIVAARNEPERTFWLSFAGQEGFRGVVLVDGCQSFEEAFLQASLAGANPHGEVQGVGFLTADLPEDQQMSFASLPRLVVLDKAALIAAGIEI